MRLRRAFVLVLLLAAPMAVPAQQPRVATALSRDSIRVGDPFRVVVRIDLPAGVSAALPDSLEAGEDIENAGRMRMRRDSANGAWRVRAVYPLTAWRPGQLPLPELSVVLRSAAGERTVAVKLPSVPVLSVLPKDTTNIQAKPAKDVLGGNRLWWPWLLAALLLLLALALAYWWYRTHRRAAVPPAQPEVMPRERALAELRRIEQLGLIEEQQFKRFYVLLTALLRAYLETVHAQWGTGLTTEELARVMGRGDELRPAVSVLRGGDMVKFARHESNQADARRDLNRARDFVQAYPPAVPEIEAGRAA